MKSFLQEVFLNYITLIYADTISTSIFKERVGVLYQI